MFRPTLAHCSHGSTKRRPFDSQMTVVKKQINDESMFCSDVFVIIIDNDNLFAFASVHHHYL